MNVKLIARAASVAGVGIDVLIIGALDVVVLVLCCASFFLCCRALIKAQKLKNVSILLALFFFTNVASFVGDGQLFHNSSTSQIGND